MKDGAGGEGLQPMQFDLKGRYELDISEGQAAGRGGFVSWVGL